MDDLTDDEIALFLERAQSSGMTEAQIEKAAKAQGYTAADIAKIRNESLLMRIMIHTPKIIKMMKMDFPLQKVQPINRELDQKI